MNLKELKNTVPETPDSFHQMVQQTVKEQLSVSDSPAKIISLPGRTLTGRRHIASLVAALAAVVILIPTVVYAAVRLYRLNISPKGDYAVTISAESDAQSGDGDAADLPGSLPVLSYQVDPIPEGFSWTNHQHLMKEDHATGFCFAAPVMDTESLEVSFTEYFITDKEELTLGEHEAVYIDHQSRRTPSFTQYLFVAYPEYQRVLIIYATNNIAKEDFLQVAANTSLVPTGEEVPTKSLFSWSEYAELTNGFEANVYRTHRSEDAAQIKEQNVSSYNIGETITSDWKGVEVTLNAVQIEDDLSLLDPAYYNVHSRTDRITYLADEDGKLLPATVDFIWYGDGQSSLDTIVDTAEVARKLVYATVTYTNTTDEAYEHLTVHPNLQIIGYLDHESLTDTAYDETLESPFTPRGHDSLIYFDVCDDETDGGNAIPYLAPGESYIVHFAWVVTEDELPYLYLEFGRGSSMLRPLEDVPYPPIESDGFSHGPLYDIRQSTEAAE